MDGTSIIAVRASMLVYLFLTGLVLGIPFPTLLRFLHAENRQDIVPYAWGINGIASVTGSLFSVILAKWFGWNLVLLFAGIVYLCTAVIFTRLRGTTRGISDPETEDAVSLMEDPDEAKLPLNV